MTKKTAATPQQIERAKECIRENVLEFIEEFKEAKVAPEVMARIVTLENLLELYRACEGDVLPEEDRKGEYDPWFLAHLREIFTLDMKEKVLPSLADDIIDKLEKSFHTMGSGLIEEALFYQSSLTEAMAYYGANLDHDNSYRQDFIQEKFTFLFKLYKLFYIDGFCKVEC